MFRLLQAAAAAKKKRGPKISITEDILIMKAWIASSEDSEKGAYQKGDVFKTTVYSNYLVLLKRYNKSHGTHYYLERGKDSIMSRFKRLSKFLLKFLSIEETTTKPSGDSALEEYEKLCRETFLTRYPEEANILESIIACKDYVEDKKPKWRKYQMDEDKKNDDKEEKKKQRPVGSKKAKQLKQDIDFAKKILGQEEVIIVDDEDDEGASKKTTKSQLLIQHQKKKEAFMDKLGNSLESMFGCKFCLCVLFCL